MDKTDIRGVFPTHTVRRFIQNWQYRLGNVFNEHLTVHYNSQNDKYIDDPDDMKGGRNSVIPKFCPKKEETSTGL